MRTRITIRPRATRRRAPESLGTDPLATQAGLERAALAAAREAVAAAERFLDRIGPESVGHAG
jgi:hypothetical protein